MGAFPAPSLRELSSERETEGVYFGERKSSKVSEFIMAGVEIIGMKQPSDDTPSVSPSGCQLPQRGSRDGVRTIQRAAQKPQRCGRFSSPLRNSECFTAQKIPWFPPGERYRVGQGTYRMGTSPKRN